MPTFAGTLTMMLASIGIHHLWHAVVKAHELVWSISVCVDLDIGLEASRAFPVCLDVMGVVWLVPIVVLAVVLTTPALLSVIFRFAVVVDWVMWVVRGCHDEVWW